MSQDLKDLPMPPAVNQQLTPPGTISQKFVEHDDDEPVTFGDLNRNLAALAQIIKPLIEMMVPVEGRRTIQEAVQAVEYGEYHALALSCIMEKLGITEADVEAHRIKLNAEYKLQKAKEKVQ